MRPFQRLLGLILRSAAERAARGRSLDDLARSLKRSGAANEARLRDAYDTPGNREAVAHVVGIERWGARRLRVGLGEPSVLDEHGPYRPSTDVPLRDLRSTLVATRAETVATVRALVDAGVDPDRRVRHNDLGEMTLRGWVTYLDQHASRELKRVRG